MNSRPIADVYQYMHTYLRDLTDIHLDNRQLENCYASKFERIFDENSILSYSFNLPSVSFTKNNELFKDIAEEAYKNFSTIKNTNPIFFYAFVGQGKTTYLKYLTEIRIYSDPLFLKLNKRTYFMYLAYTKDDSKCTNIGKDLYAKLTIKIHQILTENKIDLRNDYDVLKEIFPSEKIDYEYDASNYTSKGLLKHVRNTNNRNEFNRKITEWLLNVKGIKICCIADNIDQHFKFFEDSDYNVFTEFFQTMMSLNLQPIIPLRISNKGFQSLSFFESYHCIPINLGVPDFGDVLDRRIKYIERHFTEDLKDPIWIREDHTTLNTKELFEIFQSIVSLINSNDLVKHSLYMLCNNITREYLRIMINIFSSQPLFIHPLTGRRIDFNDRISQNKFSSLFIYSLMLRNNTQHQENDDEIPIVNLFNNQINNNWNSMIRFHLLNFLNNIKVSDIHISQLIKSFLRIYRLDKAAVKKAILSLAKKKCIALASETKIESINISELIENESCFINIALRGKFHFELANDIEYYEILAIPELEKDYRGVSETYMTERGINLKNYLEYLKKEEHHLKSIIHSENSLDNNLIWTNNYYPQLMKEWRRIFEKKHGYNKH